MSLGINDLQQAWSNWNNPAKPQQQQQQTFTASGGQPLQTSQIQLPSWLSGGSNSQMGELLNTYAGIGAAFDPTAQVQARQNAASYNLATGTSAANNAAAEYSNRAAQSGASGLGAGAVKAQAMMPVLTQNAALKTDAADIAAKSHQDAISLASQVANTIGQLRTSYLSALTGYTQGQQQLDLQNRQLQTQQLGQSQQYQMQQQQYWNQLQQQFLANGAAQQAANQRWTAPTKPTSGSFLTDAVTGQVTPGAGMSYAQLKNWNASQLV